MDSQLVRTLVATGLTVIMAALAFGTRGQPYRRATLLLGALGMGLLALYNINGLVFLAWITLAVLIVAMVCYILSWKNGEVLKRHQEMRLEMIEEVKRRRAAADAKRRTPPAGK